MWVPTPREDLALRELARFVAALSRWQLRADTFQSLSLCRTYFGAAMELPDCLCPTTGTCRSCQLHSCQPLND